MWFAVHPPKLPRFTGEEKVSDTDSHSDIQSTKSQCTDSLGYIFFLSLCKLYKNHDLFSGAHFHHTFFFPRCTRITKFMSSEVISEQSGRNVCTSDRVRPGLLFFNSSSHLTCRSRRCGIEWSMHWASFLTGKVQRSYCYSQCNAVVVNHWLTGHACLSAGTCI